MEGRKGGCLTALMIDAEWHGKVTGIAAFKFERIPQQVQPSMPDAVLKRMRPDLLPFDMLESAEPLNLDSLEHASDGCVRSTWKLYSAWRRPTLVSTKKTMLSISSSASNQRLVTHLRQAGYADVKLHLLIFGGTGGMFHLTGQHSKQLGITGPPGKTLMETLHFRALKRPE